MPQQPRSDVARVVQDGRPVDMVDFYRVELVPEHSGSLWQLGFHDTLHHVLFGFVSASDLDAVGFLGVFDHGAATPVGLALLGPDLLLGHAANGPSSLVVSPSSTREVSIVQ